MRLEGAEHYPWVVTTQIKQIFSQMLGRACGRSNGRSLQVPWLCHQLTDPLSIHQTYESLYSRLQGVATLNTSALQELTVV